MHPISLMTKSIVVVISGGLDSSTMLWHLADQGYNIKEAISFSYCQRHSKELEFSKKIVAEFGKEYYEISHQIVDLSNIGKLIASGSLTGDTEVPHEIYDSENQKLTIVPNRNMIFLSIAAGRAITLKADHIGYAAHASDYSVYPDCRPEFIEKLNEALYQGNLWTPVSLVAPFQNITKEEVVKIGTALKLPYELTWSCYEGNQSPCLKCGTCVERTEAFLNNNLQDPALTNKQWDEAVRILKEYQK